MPYSKSTQKKYGENPLKKKGPFKMKGSPMKRNFGISPMKHEKTEMVEVDVKHKHPEDPDTLGGSELSGEGEDPIKMKSSPAKFFAAVAAGTGARKKSTTTKKTTTTTATKPKTKTKRKSWVSTAVSSPKGKRKKGPSRSKSLISPWGIRT